MGDKADLQKRRYYSYSPSCKAAILQPKNNKIVPTLTEDLADAYCTSGNSTVGVQKYNSLIASDPTNAGPLNDLSLSLRRSKR